MEWLYSNKALFIKTACVLDLAHGLWFAGPWRTCNQTQVGPKGTANCPNTASGSGSRGACCFPFSPSIFSVMSLTEGKKMWAELQGVVAPGRRGWLLRCNPTASNLWIWKRLDTALRSSASQTSACVIISCGACLKCRFQALPLSSNSVDLGRTYGCAFFFFFSVV